MSERNDRCEGCAFFAGAGESTPAIGRRQFLSASTAAAVVALLAACSASDATGPTSPSGKLEVKVSDYPSLGTSGGIQLLSSYRVAVVNTGSGYTAFSLVCPHQGGAVTTGGGGFYCSRHGAQWTKDGQWIGGQPTTNLVQISSSFDAGTGVLTIG